MRLLFAAAISALLSQPPQTPDPRLTPGASDPTVMQANIHATICVHGYTAKVRHVTTATKKKVFFTYGIDPRVGGPYEVDHLISLELGGSNDIKNLWPESYTTQPLNARDKDQLENKLHALVCSGALPLATAQKAISEDWPAAYFKYVGGQ